VSELNNFPNQSSDLDNILSYFQVEPKQDTEQQDLLLNTIDELVDSPQEEIKPLEEITDQVNTYNNSLESENQKLRAKINDLEAIIAKNAVIKHTIDFPGLVHQLEISNETIKNQQLMIETLSRQLEKTQEDMSNLERECAQIQEQCSQQSYKLLETEKQLQELHSRLLRQQRYTLEYKTVLEECFKENTAAILSINNSLIKQKGGESSLPQSEAEKTTEKIPKSQWPSPGIDTEKSPEMKKDKKIIDLPTFIK